MSELTNGSTFMRTSRYTSKFNEQKIISKSSAKDKMAVIKIQESSLDSFIHILP